MNCCFLKKKEPNRLNTVFPAASPNIDQIDVSVQCGRCRSPQAIPKKAAVFVCSACRCVNRIRYSEATQERRMSFIDCDVGETKMLPNTPTLFQLGDASGADKGTIPVCSVCLDGIGDMVLDTCNHGGICEECSRHIALNKAVGGCHCPKCRTEITHILRIGELHDDFAKVREVELPKHANSSPPLVPPPVGYRKEKGNEPSTPHPTTESQSQDES